jgi:hypothetical protein
MRLTDAQLATAKLLAESDPVVKALLDHYNYVTASQVYESYIMRKAYIESWNKELLEKKINIINTGKDADVHDKAVERAVKWFDGQLSFLKDTEAMLSMMTPEERTNAINDPRLKKHITDIAL